ncbi:MAG TPA: hypothetical protein EYQ61_06345 [Dehalococcoidia bacterium]|nr:hypothetical protein [Dehalococcoidia bacterium]HIK89752.1 hypothetical protein [Dehalococcoidia bacterium]
MLETLVLEGVEVPRKRHCPEQILRKLREIEVALAKGEAGARAVRQIAVTEQTYYRWRREYGGLVLSERYNCCIRDDHNQIN